MAKLTKARSKVHRQAEELLAKDVLTLDEKVFVYENWNEAALHDNTRSGAFFTPVDLANDFKLEVPGPRILDICAGIGILSFCKLHFHHHGPDRPPAGADLSDRRSASSRNSSRSARPNSGSLMW